MTPLSRPRRSVRIIVPAFLGSGCGCDFPHVGLQNGQWPTIEDTEKDELDVARDISDRRNKEALVALLQTTGDKMVFT